MLCPLSSAGLRVTKFQIYSANFALRRANAMHSITQTVHTDL